ncbi:AcrR family transcriptional regulator [Elusimicrobium posterum]|uniref:TetR/AcrR family transcriptional regulator n=1 Tax=Elusimicrobium posterum TaxID=3116653 RepID=UPI003C77C02B
MEKLTKPQRDAKRRKEIVEAAKRCVAQRGFHSTSVAMIAKEAGINVGQLYRYFETKEDIIEAISEDVFARNVDNFKSHGDFISGIIKQKEEGIIMMEIQSEVNRNPKVDKIMQKAEKKMSAFVLGEIKKAAPNLTDEEAQMQEAIMMVLTGGLGMFASRKRGMTKEKVKELSEFMFSRLLPDLAKK